MKTLPIFRPAVAVFAITIAGLAADGPADQVRALQRETQAAIQAFESRSTEVKIEENAALEKEFRAVEERLKTRLRGVRDQEARDAAIEQYKAGMQAIAEHARFLKENPAPKYAAKLLELGERLGKDPVAAGALVSAAQYDRQGNIGRKAMEMLARDHINSPSVLPIINMLPRLEDESGNGFLRAIVDRSTDPTLKAAAQKALDQIARRADFAVGKVAPEITGRDIEGRPFKLSDYRGKVVALVFCGDWCGPCRAMYPHERSLIERLKDRPFALIGVNSDSVEKFKEAMKRESLTWRFFWDAGSPNGPIAREWGVISWPTIYVLDAKGVIRFKNVRDAAMDQAVDSLLAEMEKDKK